MFVRLNGNAARYRADSRSELGRASRFSDGTQVEIGNQVWEVRNGVWNVEGGNQVILREEFLDSPDWLPIAVEYPFAPLIERSEGNDNYGHIVDSCGNVYETTLSLKVVQGRKYRATVLYANALFDSNLIVIGAVESPDYAISSFPDSNEDATQGDIFGASVVWIPESDYNEMFLAFQVVANLDVLFISIEELVEGNRMVAGKFMFEVGELTGINIKGLATSDPGVRDQIYRDGDNLVVSNG